jgi:hypothetical protein
VNLLAIAATLWPPASIAAALLIGATIRHADQQAQR